MLDESNPAAAPRPLLYEDLAAKVGRMIEERVFRPGDRVPSIRTLSRQMRVSVNTVMEAYGRLEDQGVLEARPQSGHYVRYRVATPLAREGWQPDPAGLAPRNVLLSAAQAAVQRSLADPALVPLASGTPDPALLPVEKLNRLLAGQARRFAADCSSYAGCRGLLRLRTQIAKRLLDSGCSLSPEEIVVTSGCAEGVTLALQVLCRPGDTVAVGTPVYHRYLETMQWMGLRILEIPCSPRDGMNLDVLRYALERNPVQACLVHPNFNNPLGSLMPAEHKRDLVAFLARRQIPLIEDDVYGDLGFSVRPPSAKAYDRSGLVLSCSSFSKTLAPGYRVGWIAAGRFQPEVERLKTLFNIATASPTQFAIAEFLANGGYDHHLRRLRRTCAVRMARVREAIGRAFPHGTRITRPEGGTVLWVELPEGMDAGLLHERALAAGVAIVPGTLFTLGDAFRNCFRVNGTLWSERIEAAIGRLGDLVVHPADRRLG
jgi:DNA-binding transcriptional MocR family regulator